jgi:hypothetical protein
MPNKYKVKERQDRVNRKVANSHVPRGPRRKKSWLNPLNTAEAVKDQAIERKRRQQDKKRKPPTTQK